MITEQEPEITSEELASIQDVLGTCTTDFSSSGAARSTNLSVGAAKINGRVMMPGEVLSGYECLQPFTTSNGYKTAAAYENGKVVDSIGGGVCQIATTLYGASLEAEVEIVQRQNHSMIVTYVEPSMDAAIAGTYKDIEIKNNYSTPIYVEAYTSGKKLTFTLYGKETRPEGRKVEYISETIGTTSPGEPQLIVDNTLAPGAKVRVQSSHTGLRSRLWKVVTVDGVETERTLLNKDTYNASKAVYRVGPEAPVNAPVQTDPAGGQTAGAGENTSPESPGAENVAGGPGMPGESGTVPGGGPGAPAGGTSGSGAASGGPGAPEGAGGAAEQFPVEAPEHRQRPEAAQQLREVAGSSRPSGGGSMRTAGQGPGGFEKRDGHINPGQELIFAGSAGLAGARRILEAKKEILSRRFAPSFLRELKEEEYSVKSWLDQATAEKKKSGYTWEFAGEGGVLAALWNFFRHLLHRTGRGSAAFSLSIRRLIEVCDAV